jgi:hypothetical protein
MAGAPSKPLCVRRNISVNVEVAQFNSAAMHKILSCPIFAMAGNILSMWSNPVAIGAKTPFNGIGASGLRGSAAGFCAPQGTRRGGR